MSFFRSHAGFNITCDKIQLVEIDYKETDQADENVGFYLENVDEEFFSEFLDLSFPETKIINILQTAYNELVLRKPLGTNYISFSLPNNFFKIFQLPIDSKITSKDLSEHLKWEISLLYPDNDPDGFVIRHIGKENDSDNRVVNAVVFSVYKKYLKVLHKFSVRNNLILKYIDNAHIAADAFITALSINNTVASILLDEKLFSISMLQNQQLEYFKSFPINSITEFIDKLNEELSSYSHIKDKLTDSNIYISGNFVSDNLLNKLQEISGYKFLLLNPFEKIKTSSILDAKNLVNKKPFAFSSAAGLALRLV